MHKLHQSYILKHQLPTIQAINSHKNGCESIFNFILIDEVCPASDTQGTGTGILFERVVQLLSANSCGLYAFVHSNGCIRTGIRVVGDEGETIVDIVCMTFMQGVHHGPEHVNSAVIYIYIYIYNV